jgi:hypothetical protein
MNEVKYMSAAKEEVKCVALGEDIEAEIAEVQPLRKPATADEKINEMQQQILHLTSAFDSLARMVKELRDDYRRDKDEKLNGLMEEKKKAGKAEIPEGTVLIGTTKGLSYFLQVKEGGFFVGAEKYESLSAAAEGVSGVRRSGWTFWKLSDGRSIKEVYKI